VKQRLERSLLRNSFTTSLLILSLLALILGSAGCGPATTAKKPGPVIAPTPFMGWSTWYFDGNNPTAASIEAQADVVASKFARYGYDYILLDDHYYLNPGTTVDSYGRWVANPAQFPQGIAAVASSVHKLGLKFGIYVTPGIPVAAVQQNTPVQGTKYHARDVALVSKYAGFENNWGGFGHVMYPINYYKPGAQAYINSWADLYASWGVDFLKIDAVTTANIPDIQAWSRALRQTGRPMLFDLSNTLDITHIDDWRKYANAWRIDGDVQCYTLCPSTQQVTWETLVTRFADVPAWSSLAGPGGWNDLDSLNIADGTALDGLTNDERQTYMTLWAIEAAPLYMGDDLTHMDNYGFSLLTNAEVIAIDQQGKAARPLSQTSDQQVWFVKNNDGSYTVALFNLAQTPATVTVNWQSLGIKGSATVRDLWSHTDLGMLSTGFSVMLNMHASRLLKVVSKRR
jgi:hypothetical protein